MNGAGSTGWVPGSVERRLRPRPGPGPVEPPRRGLFRRRANRRVTVSSPSVALWIARHLQGVARPSLVIGKALAAIAVLAGVAWGGEQAIRHVIASPRFAVREVRVGPTQHVHRDEVLGLAGVAPGDKLLSIDTDAVAVRVAGHPWVAAARVRRELPSMLVVDVTERRAVAVAVLGGLYLIDENGRPFKRATLEEADGLTLLTGLSRQQYAAFRDASEAAYREALEILDEYRAPGAPEAAAAPAGPARRSGHTRALPPGPSASASASASAAAAPAPRTRPPLSEIHIDPRLGFSLFLYDGGGEIRLGRGDYTDKLERLDRIFAGLGGLGARGPAALRTVHLDGPNRDRVAVRLADGPAH